MYLPNDLRSGKLKKNYGKSPCLMGKLKNFLWPCSIAICNKLLEGKDHDLFEFPKMWARIGPPVINWFMNPMNTILKSIITPIVIVYSS